MPPPSLRQMIGAWLEHTAQTTTLADVRASASKGAAAVKRSYAKHGLGRAFLHDLAHPEGDI